MNFDYNIEYRVADPLVELEQSSIRKIVEIQ